MTQPCRGADYVDVIIVGAGLGGLATAALLGARGLRVTVLEAADQEGGKLGFLETRGYRFDTGPSLLTMPGVLADLFADCGERLSDHLTLTPLDPACRYRWPDGRGFDAHANVTLMAAELEAFAAGSGQEYLKLAGRARRAFLGAEAVYFSRLPGPPTSYLKGLPPGSIAAMLPWPSLHALGRAAFSNPRLQDFLDRYATYSGSDPRRAPATLVSVLHAELGLGAHHVNGGLYAVVTALRGLAERRGAIFRFSSPVERILTSGGRATGVVTKQGEVLAAGAVIVNADPHYLPRLLGRPKWRPPHLKAKPSTSGLALLVGVRGKLAELAHHNVFFPNNYEREFDDLAAGRMPTDPTLYVCAPSRTDASLAPDGCENLFVLVNAPALPAGPDWTQETPAVTGPILAALARRGLDLSGRIEVLEARTPRDLAVRAGAWRGAIYGSAVEGMSGLFRPSNRVPDVKGLYLASGGAHPGGGIPLALISGRLAARALQDDLKRYRTAR